MLFSDYLKSCRLKYNFTQEELVSSLYTYHDNFSKLDVTTYSRWERGVTQPSSDKKIDIINFYQTLCSEVFPCFSHMKKEDIEDELCRVSIANLLGKSKSLILNFPSVMMEVDDMKIFPVTQSDDLDKILKMAYTLDKELSNNFSPLQEKHYKQWAQNPNNFFLITEFQNQFFGMFFTIRLKESIFNKLLNFKMSEDEITENDFADFNEIGCNYILSFFAYNDKAATLLILRYYAHLISHQEFISEVGVLTILEDARKMIDKLHLKHYKTDEVTQGTLTSHRASLEEVLISESVLKVIFSKEEKCS
jgi:transcriptional regulator with XRE-family HTH domain